MIRHVVMWKFKEENKKANMEHAREILYALKPVIKELRRMEIGFDISGTDMSYHDTDIRRNDRRKNGR